MNWGQGLYRGNQVKVKSIQYDRGPYYKGKPGHICLQGEGHAKMEGGIRLMHLQAKEHQRLPASQQKLGEV